MPLSRKLRYLAQANRFQWKSLEEIRAVQYQKLRATLEHAEAEVPLYRERFKEAGVKASDLRSLEDLQHFPMVKREEIIAAYPEGCLSRKPTDRDTVFRTSGTSGAFMSIAYSEDGHDFLDAIYARSLFSTGYRPWDRIAYYWWENKKTRFYEYFGLMRKHFFKVGPDPRVHLKELQELQPRVIYNFPSLMLMIARLVEREGFGGLRPEIIICHGELMPRETQDEIARIFQCPVWNQYGSQEFNRMGWNCGETQSLHMDADSVVIEVLHGDTPAPPGEEGDLVVTGLANTLMPLIRYRIGDMGRLIEEPCTCGRGLPLFEVTEGRRDDLIQLPNGNTIGPRAIAPRVEDLHGFNQYRIIQDKLDHLQVSLVLDEEAQEDTTQQVEAVLRELMGEEMKITLQTVDEISLSSRGKLRKVVSEIGKSATA